MGCSTRLGSCSCTCWVDSGQVRHVSAKLCLVSTTCGHRSINFWTSGRRDSRATLTPDLAAPSPSPETSPEVGRHGARREGVLSQQGLLGGVPRQDGLREDRGLRGRRVGRRQQGVRCWRPPRQCRFGGHVLTRSVRGSTRVPEGCSPRHWPESLRRGVREFASSGKRKRVGSWKTTLLEVDRGLSLLGAVGSPEKASSEVLLPSGRSGMRARSGAAGGPQSRLPRERRLPESEPRAPTSARNAARASALGAPSQRPPDLSNASLAEPTPRSFPPALAGKRPEVQREGPGPFTRRHAHEDSRPRHRCSYKSVVRPGPTRPSKCRAQLGRSGIAVRQTRSMRGARNRHAVGRFRRGGGRDAKKRRGAPSDRL